ncbi:MAG: response regulator, partial [Asticcacaulis sp.]
MTQNVLVVEDSKTQARIVETLLIKAGATVHIANDRLEALQKLKAHTFQLIVLDVFIGQDDSLD